MSRSSTNSLSDPSTSQSSGSLLLSNPIHVGAVNNTSNPHNLASLSSLEASGSTYSDRPVLSEAAVPRVLSQPQESFSQSRYSQQNPSPVVPSLGSHLGLYNVSNPCPVPFPEAGQSQLGPLTSRSTPLPPQFAQPMHSSLVSFQPPVVGLPLARPFGHDTRPPAPWQSNVGSTVSTAPGLAKSGTLYYFPLTMPRYLGTRDLYPPAPTPPRSFDNAMVIGPGFNPVPHRLVTAITSGHYVDLAALLASPSEESSVPTLTLDGRLVIAPPPPPPQITSDFRHCPLGSSFLHLHVCTCVIFSPSCPRPIALQSADFAHSGSVWRRRLAEL